MSKSCSSVNEQVLFQGTAPSSEGAVPIPLFKSCYVRSYRTFEMVLYKDATVSIIQNT